MRPLKALHEYLQDRLGSEYLRVFAINTASRIASGLVLLACAHIRL